MVTVGFNTGAWETLVAGAKGNLVWRSIGSDGNGAADTVFISISVQFR